MGRPITPQPAIGGPDWGRLALILAWLLVLLCLSRSLNLTLYLGDEGVATMDAWRISQGQVPHRDFFEIIPPFSFLPTAGLYWLFGPSVAATRLLAVGYGLLLTLLAERLTARLTPLLWPRVLVVAVLGPGGVSFWPMPSHHWVVDILQLGAILSLFAALGANRARLWATLSGALCALACFSMQDQGAYLVLALPLLFFPWLSDRVQRRRLFWGWAGGGLAVLGAFSLYFAAARVPLSELLTQLVVFPAHSYRGVNANPAGVFTGWDSVLSLWGGAQGASGWLRAASTTTLEGLVSLAPAAGLFTLCAAWIKKWAPAATVGLIAAGLLAFLGGCAHRWSLTNLHWALPMTVIPLAWALGHALQQGRPLARKIAAGAIAVILFGSATYSLLFFFRSAPSRTTPVRSPAGTLRTLSASEGASVQEAVDALGSLVPEGAPVFIDGYMPLVGFLSLHPNPTRYTFFYEPQYNTAAQAQEVLGVLDKLPVAYALVALPIRPESVTHRYFLASFRPVWRNDRAVLFVKEKEMPPPQDIPQTAR